LLVSTAAHPNDVARFTLAEALAQFQQRNVYRAKNSHGQELGVESVNDAERAAKRRSILF
jgi:hypothetical protein